MKKVAILFIVLLTSSFVFAQNTYVPDDKFEQALIDLGYDDTLDDYVLTANISGVTALEVYGKEISDLTGIEDFTALKELYCWSNQLTSLDVSKNTALVRLKCANNKLTSLDVSNNTALNELESNLNQLTSLDVTANTVLTYLRVDDNQLTSLDVSKNVALENLLCYRNQLTSLDVSKNTALRELLCYSNQLTSLDVSKNTALTSLSCYSNQLTSLDVSKNTALTTLDCYKNQLTSLDVSKNTALIKFDSRYNQLTSLNFRNGITDALTEFRVTSNSDLTCIETLDPAYATTNWTDIDAGVTFTYICGVDVDGVSSYNNNGIKAITFNVDLPVHSLPDTNISLAFWKSGAENNECTSCNGRDTVSMRKLSDDHWEATVGLDTTLVAGDVGESMYWYHYIKTIPEYKINEDSERFKSEPNPNGLRQLEPGWHKETSLVNKDTVIAWNNIAPFNFDWVSAASDTIKISQTNIGDTYELKWSESKDVDIDTIEYLLYAQIGVYPAEEVYDTTSTSVQITYEEFLENVFEETPGNGVIVKFSVSATDGKDTVKVSGDDRVIYVNRYEYLSTEGEGVPVEFALHENYPNPFNPTTTLRFDLPEVSNLTLTIYNMLGQKVRTFNYQNTSAGYHSVKWNATNDYGDPVGAGVYLYQLRANQYVKTRKMVLLK
jgi:Leucine-rich repeat (LRR) protein